MFFSVKKGGAEGLAVDVNLWHFLVCCFVFIILVVVKLLLANAQ